MNQTVTVIIPVFNASSYLEEMLQAIENQTYNQEKTEILVIDNGSLDGTAAIAEQFPVKLLFETNKKGPYAARNEGFRHANGDIIALTDANKIPDKNWIEEGVKALIDNNAALAGGDIQFSLSDNPAAAEIYDAITFNNNRKIVEEEKASAAGNLFFRREVLDKTGYFPEGFRSGMDIWWTRKAVNLGFILVFAEKARVTCKPRPFAQILKKSYRVGKTHPYNQRQAGLSVFAILLTIFRTFSPPRMQPIKNKMISLNLNSSVAKVWFVAWFSKIQMGLGRVYGLFYLKKEK